jgi:hypothetical protein
MTVPIEDIDGRCNCLAVCKAARYLRAAYDKALAPSGLRATQFTILYKLAIQTNANPLDFEASARRWANDKIRGPPGQDPSHPSGPDPLT